MKKMYDNPTVKVLSAVVKNQILTASDGGMTIGSSDLGIDGQIIGGDNPSAAI